MTVCGDGGMITTNDKEIASTAFKLRDCGRQSQYVHDEIGYTCRLNTVNAAIGRVQLKRLDEWNNKRRKIANKYDQLLRDFGDLILPPKPDKDTNPVYHLYVLRTKKRDKLRNWLESKGISCGIHYPLPIHLQPIYQKIYGYQKGNFANSEKLCDTCLSIPIYPSLTESEISFISEQISSFFLQ